MYKWFVVKRILRGALIYATVMVVLAVLFNTVREQTLYSQIEEQIRQETMNMQNVTGEQMLQYRDNRRDELYRQNWLDRSYIERVTYQAWSAVTFNFGKATNMRSSQGDTKVTAILGEAIPKTALLFTTVMVLQLIVGILLGLKKAQKPGGKLDKSTTIMTLVVTGMPSWWVAMIIIMVFVYGLGWFPSGGVTTVPPPEGGLAAFLDVLWHMVLPVGTLLFIGFWGTSFTIRNIVLGTLQEDFITAARARGIPERNVLYKHTLRTAAPPIVTMALLSILVSMVGGSIIFEGIFSWPGLGKLYWVATQQNDIPVLMGSLALSTAIYQMGLIILDLIYGFLDPRVKVGGKA